MWSSSSLCLSTDLKVFYVHVLLMIVGNSVYNIKIRLIYYDLFRS